MTKKTNQEYMDNALGVKRQCAECGIKGHKVYKFKGRRICRACLNPDVTARGSLGIPASRVKSSLGDPWELEG